MTAVDTTDRINELIAAEQFSLPYDQKRAALLPILEEQVRAHRQAMPQYDRYCRRMRFAADDYADYTAVPYLPVSVFKTHDLCAVDRDSIVRVLTSSATTTGTASRIYLDKPTSFRQAKALSRILMHYLGKHKRPMLVLDSERSNADAASLTARGAAIRGLASFASEITYGLREDGGDLVPEVDTITGFYKRHRDSDVLLFGFTYMVWINTVLRLREAGVEVAHPRSVLFHSGGWKKLTQMQVPKEAFNHGVHETLGVPLERIHDFYGMVEQVGVIFVDCEAGNKHTPNFAEVVLRDFLTLQPVEPGQSGMIEVLSILPISYPGQALLTEDVGTLAGYDDCPCGRQGMYFRFRSRVERAEVRGCGDTFAASRVIS